NCLAANAWRRSARFCSARNHGTPCSNKLPEPGVLRPNQTESSARHRAPLSPTPAGVMCGRVRESKPHHAPATEDTTRAENVDRTQLPAQATPRLEQGSRARELDRMYQRTTFVRAGKDHTPPGLSSARC